MAQDINNGSLTCRLAADPELRSLPSGMSVCQLRVAFNNSKKDPTTGEWSDVGNFINVKVWGKQGENVARFLSKGSRIGLTYRIEHRTWETQEGQKREAHELIAERVVFLSSKEENGGGQQQASAPAQTSAPADDGSDYPF